MALPTVSGQVRDAWNGDFSAELTEGTEKRIGLVRWSSLIS